MGSGYFYAPGGERVGPVQAEEIRRLFADGQLGQDDPVCQEGTAEWVPAAKIEGLLPPAVDGPPLSDRTRVYTDADFAPAADPPTSGPPPLPRRGRPRANTPLDLDGDDRPARRPNPGEEDRRERAEPGRHGDPRPLGHRPGSAADEGDEPPIRRTYRQAAGWYEGLGRDTKTWLLNFTAVFVANVLSGMFLAFLAYVFFLMMFANATQGFKAR
ncbi:MAG: DUF4339 domain-containing protein [Gemmataceae bacterium]|nr:DUF4339 domain-containing protein [Gemmataceae bacterium]